MKRIELSMQEIWTATKPVIHKNKKRYNRKKAIKNLAIHIFD